MSYFHHTNYYNSNTPLTFLLIIPKMPCSYKTHTTKIKLLFMKQKTPQSTVAKAVVGKFTNCMRNYVVYAQHWSCGSVSVVADHVPMCWISKARHDQSEASIQRIFFVIVQPACSMTDSGVRLCFSPMKHGHNARHKLLPRLVEQKHALAWWI